MLVLVNGKEVKYAGRFDDNTFRVVTTEDEVIDYIPKEVNISFGSSFYKTLLTAASIHCEIVKGKEEHKGTIGRVCVLKVKDTGEIEVVPFKSDAEVPLVIKVQQKDLDCVRELVKAGHDSLLVFLPKGGPGIILETTDDLYYTKSGGWQSTYNNELFQGDFVRRPVPKAPMF